MDEEKKGTRKGTTREGKRKERGGKGSTRISAEDTRKRRGK